MIYQLIILQTTTSLFSQVVKCRTYVPEKYSVGYNLNRRQTYRTTEQRQIVNVDKGQEHPNGLDNSPLIILTDKAIVIIIGKGTHSGTGQPPDGFTNSSPTAVTSLGKVAVNYDDGQDEYVGPSSNHQADICLSANTMVELPSGIVMPYLKFKTISPCLPEDQKSDIRVILDDKRMTYKQFRETLRNHGCSEDLEDTTRPPETDLTNYVTVANGTKVEMDDYREIVSSITSGSETLTVPNVVTGKYSLYRSLIADVLPELIPSAFVITRTGIVVPFSVYYAVDRERFQRPPPNAAAAAVVPAVRQIKWRDGRLVDVQTVRHVIDALRTPAMISFVFPNRKRLPFVRRGEEEPEELYDCDPEKVVVDVGQCNNVLLSHFNDILFAAHIPDHDSSSTR